MTLQAKLMILSALLSFIIILVLFIIGIVVCRGVGFILHMWLHVNSVQHVHNWFIRRADHDEEAHR